LPNVAGPNKYLPDLASLSIKIEHISERLTLLARNKKKLIKTFFMIPVDTPKVKKVLFTMEVPEASVSWKKV
jgi:hypothetical protein